MEGPVSVTARKYHTLRGVEHNEGDVYEVDAADVDNLVAQGMVAPQPAPPAPPRESQPVTPLTSDDFK